MAGNTSNEEKKYDVVITRIFDAPVEQVWKAWSDPEYVKQWWGPTGFSCPVAKINFREGGTSLVCMRAPQEFGGQDVYNTWTYAKITPMERIEYVLHFCDENGNTYDPAEKGLLEGIPFEVRNVNTFERLANGKTELTIHETSYTSERARELSIAGMEQCLDKMAACIAGA